MIFILNNMENMENWTFLVFNFISHLKFNVQNNCLSFEEQI